MEGDWKDLYVVHNTDLLTLCPKKGVFKLPENKFNIKFPQIKAEVNKLYQFTDALTVYEPFLFICCLFVILYFVLFYTPWNHVKCVNNNYEFKNILKI